MRLPADAVFVTARARWLQVIGATVQWLVVLAGAIFLFVFAGELLGSGGAVLSLRIGASVLACGSLEKLVWRGLGAMGVLPSVWVMKRGSDFTVGLVDWFPSWRRLTITRGQRLRISVQHGALSPFVFVPQPYTLLVYNLRERPRRGHPWVVRYFGNASSLARDISLALKGIGVPVALDDRGVGVVIGK